MSLTPTKTKMKDMLNIEIVKAKIVFCSRKYIYIKTVTFNKSIISVFFFTMSKVIPKQ